MNSTENPPNALKYEPVSEVEQQYFMQLFRLADVNQQNAIDGRSAVMFFSKSGIENALLKEIWNLSVCNQMGVLRISEFYTALRLISIVQMGGTPTVESFQKLQNTSLALPRFVGIPLPALSYAVKPEEVGKYIDIFKQYDKDGDGFLLGSEAVGLFQLSGLEIPILRSIWTIADQNSDNQLDIAEFCIAMHLIVCLSKRNMSLPNGLPRELEQSTKEILKSMNLADTKVSTPQDGKVQAQTTGTVEEDGDKFDAFDNIASPKVESSKTINEAVNVNISTEGKSVVGNFSDLSPPQGYTPPSIHQNVIPDNVGNFNANTHMGIGNPSITLKQVNSAEGICNLRTDADESHVNETKERSSAVITDLHKYKTSGGLADQFQGLQSSNTSGNIPDHAQKYSTSGGLADQFQGLQNSKASDGLAATDPHNGITALKSSSHSEGKKYETTVCSSCVNLNKFLSDHELNNDAEDDPLDKQEQLKALFLQLCNAVESTHTFIKVKEKLFQTVEMQLKRTILNTINDENAKLQDKIEKAQEKLRTLQKLEKLLTKQDFGIKFPEMSMLPEENPFHNFTVK